MNAWIRINATQTVDDEDDVVDIETEGTLEPTEKGWQLRYKETEATGLKGTSTLIEVENDKLSIDRSGEHPSMLVLEKNRRHHCNYQTPFGSIDLGTYASEIDCRLTAAGGSLNFSYTLGFNGGISSAHTVHITVQEEK